MIKRLIFTILSLAASGYAQGYGYHDTVVSSLGMPVASPTIRVCNEPASGTPCTPLAAIYSDLALANPIANPMTGTTTGNFTFYALPGTYHVQISGTGISAYDLPNISIGTAPTAAGVNDVGGALLPFRSFYVGAAATNNAKITGTFAAARVFTLPDTASDTFAFLNATQTFTGKTFDTAGAGNSFLINGLAATSNVGTGAVVRATSPTLVTPVLGVATGTSLNLGGTGVLSTTAQSGTGSLCMTVSCTLVTPALGVATATSLTATGLGTFAGVALSANNNGYVLGASSDSGIWRLGAGSFAFGSGSSGDFTGTVKAAHFNATSGLVINGALELTSQTGTGQAIVTSVGPNITIPVVNQGISNIGTGYKHVRSVTTCTTGAAIGAACTTAAINWPGSAFIDTNYDLVCTLSGSVTNVPTIVSTTKSNGSFTVTIAALTAAAASYSEVDCSATHD